MMSPIAFFHPYPKHLQITDALRHRLGGMQVGDKLPPEVDLGKEFGVSRDTVRQALEPLAKEGLIRRTQGRGSFVQKLPEARSVRKLTGAVEDFSSLGLKTHA
ncbi:MAG: GntR family transcriptional regulator, partial [Candidatus Methylomirabilota bacterium]